MAGDWWLVAGGSVFEAFGGSALEVFGGFLVDLGTIGAHWVQLGSSNFRGLRGHFWYAWAPL